MPIVQPLVFSTSISHFTQSPGCSLMLSSNHPTIKKKKRFSSRDWVCQKRHVIINLFILLGTIIILLKEPIIIHFQFTSREYSVSFSFKWPVTWKSSWYHPKFSGSLEESNKQAHTITDPPPYFILSISKVISHTFIFCATSDPPDVFSTKNKQQDLSFMWTIHTPPVKLRLQSDSMFVMLWPKGLFLASFLNCRLFCRQRGKMSLEFSHR